jgi:molybdenum cofactor synthesis domain-containing protein
MITVNTASIIIIGDEILSGRTKDENSSFLISQLSQRGIKVNYCITIPDEPDIIKDTIFEYSKKTTWCFTAGGIGPTHDDMTMEGVANAFGVSLIKNNVLADIVKKLYGAKCNEEHLKMAMVPDGTTLPETIDPRFPAIQFKNIFILPGVPEFLQAIFHSISYKFKGIVTPSDELTLSAEEGLISTVLKDTISKYPGVKIGSYPCFQDEKCRVKLVVEHEKNENLIDAIKYLRNQLIDYLI